MKYVFEGSGYGLCMSAMFATVWLRCKANSFSAAAFFSQICLFSRSWCLLFLLPSSFFLTPCSQLDSFSFLLTSRVRIQKSSTADCFEKSTSKTENTYCNQCFLLSSSYLWCFSSAMHLSPRPSLFFVIPSSIFIFFISVSSSCFLSFSCLFKVVANMPV